MLGTLILTVGLITTNDSFAVERLEAHVGKQPLCLSRFVDFPPGRGILGFPRCLFENPFKSNPDFWLKGIDFSCASPWNDSYGSLRAGTAISKRHIVFARHFPLSVGTRIAFVGVNGDVSHYSIEATKHLEKSDIMIGLLDYELTPDVHPARVLPSNFVKWIKVGTTWPAVTFNQRKECYLSECSCMTNLAGRTVLGNRPSKRWKEFGGKIIVGDSGNPAFLLYHSKPILLYCLSGGGVGIGPMIHEHYHDVQRLMDDLCPGYKLEEFDFTAAKDLR